MKKIKWEIDAHIAGMDINNLWQIKQKPNSATVPGKKNKKTT